MSKSDYLETAVLNLLRGTSISAVANYYVSLHTADPGDTGASEVSGGSYARVAVSAATGSWSSPAASSGAMETHNAGAITFPTATADWGTVTHFGIWDASTSGNLLYSGTLTTSRAILNGDTTPTFAASALSITES